jgi:hypothetical protein
MDNKELRAKLVAMRNAIEDYLDNIDMDSAEEPKKKQAKKEKA